MEPIEKNKTGNYKLWQLPCTAFVSGCIFVKIYDAGNFLSERRHRQSLLFGIDITVRIIKQVKISALFVASRRSQHTDHDASCLESVIKCDETVIPFEMWKPLWIVLLAAKNYNFFLPKKYNTDCDFFTVWYLLQKQNVCNCYFIGQGVRQNCPLHFSLLKIHCRRDSGRGGGWSRQHAFS